MTATTQMPLDFNYGKVIGRYVLAVADASDGDRLPDAVPVVGSITFAPAQANVKALTPKPTTVVKVAIKCTLNGDGELVDPQGNLGVWLMTGVYKVAYSLANVSLAAHDILVLPEHDDQNPLDLYFALPPGGPVLSPSQYAELSARISVMEAGDGNAVAAEVTEHKADTTDVHGIPNTADLVLTTDPRLGDARTPTVHNHDDRYFTETEVTQALADKAPTSHSHTSAEVTDWKEAVQDALATFFNVTGATASYNDADDQIVITVPPDTNTTDPEAVRDAIGASIVALGNLSVVINDAADTITISTTATVNSTDAALRDRSTHQGTQPMSSVEGLALALEGKQPSGSYASAAQGAKADSAVQSNGSVLNVISMTQADYDALVPKVATTLYVIVPA